MKKILKWVNTSFAKKITLGRCTHQKSKFSKLKEQEILLIELGPENQLQLWPNETKISLSCPTLKFYLSFTWIRSQQILSLFKPSKKFLPYPKHHRNFYYRLWTRWYGQKYSQGFLPPQRALHLLNPSRETEEVYGFQIYQLRLPLLALAIFHSFHPAK